MTDPDLATAENAVRAALKANDFAQGEALARAAIAKGRNDVVIWQLLVHALRAQGRHQEARPIQEMLVEHLPGHLTMRFDLAEILLLLGDFERGWREYHYRYSLPHTVHFDRKVQRPVWNGQPIPGKTLLIHDEQGYGDTFQFIRLAAWAKERSGARVVVQIHPDQLGFARRMAGIDEVIPRGALPPPFDMHCQMMSLPRAMKLKQEDLPGPMPYLSADEQRIAYWRERLAALPQPLVALVWAGSETHGNDANRSIPLSALAPLAACDASFVSVQKGARAAEAEHPPAGMNLTNLSPEIRDFDDTAAILNVCDLLITVDSSPAHLAGALNRPTWVLLPFVPDWRWLLEREDSPWYPRTRLFRQTAYKDWSGTLVRMTAALQAFVKDTQGQPQTPSS